MLSLPRVLVLVFATFAVSGLAASTSTSSDGYQPLNPVGIVTRSLRPKADVYLTNAQRLSRGLPPNRPRRNGRPASSSKPSPSSTCVTKTGYIQADVARQGTGYVSKKVNAYGEYGFTHDVSKALSISYCAKRGSGTVDIATSNGPSSYDFLGLIAGFGNTDEHKNLDGSNYNYAYLGGVSKERRGPAAVDGNSFTDATGVPEPSESNVWAIGRANHITASWVNTDGSTAPLQFLYYKGHGNNNFIVTANADLTQATFGPGHAATLTFVAA
ncbi:hypothetical protein OH76DRAFT_1488687 [Lentinus brumalis]|uniref:Uncharacterized protein n=1 Tax=Lentinus brumalis TaxID=2498619 RepID=A0A371CQ72_9APHY|nr:hypothetical protein OH76DRAFT_1488687 [Polyporus brumalis]